MQIDLVQNIKDCGLSMVNNAEKIVSGLPPFYSYLTITCYPSEPDKPAYINVSYDFIPEGIINKNNGDE